MRTFPPARAGAAAAVLAAAAAVLAACGSPQPSPPAAAPASASAAPGASTGFPVTVTTTAGQLHLAAPPKAIISLSPTATEMLYAIGAGSQVRAVDSLSDYPAGAPVTKLSAYQPNAEAIAAYKPDLVIISNDMDGITAKLRQLSIPVLDQPAADGLAGMYAEISQLGAVTGHAGQARAEDAKLKKDIAAIVAAEPKRTAKLTYFYELGANPYYSATDSTFIGSALSLLGLRSIADTAKGAAAAGGYPELSGEFILKSRPDYILLSDTGGNGGQTPATLARRPGWSALAAVRDGHVITLNADIASRWGPRIVQLLQSVAKATESGSP